MMIVSRCKTDKNMLPQQKTRKPSVKIAAALSTYLSGKKMDNYSSKTMTTEISF